MFFNVRNVNFVEVNKLLGMGPVSASRSMFRVTKLGADQFCGNCAGGQLLFDISMI